jgi:hypothetical protein
MARRRRCLENGRWYKNSFGIKVALSMQKVAAARPNIHEQMKKVRENAQTPEVKAKRTLSRKKFIKNHPKAWHYNRIRMYQQNPGLAESRTTLPPRNHFADIELVRKRSETKNGKQIVKKVQAKRRKSTGVVIA